MVVTAYLFENYEKIKFKHGRIHVGLSEVKHSGVGHAMFEKLNRYESKMDWLELDINAIENIATIYHSAQQTAFTSYITEWRKKGATYVGMQLDEKTPMILRVSKYKKEIEIYLMDGCENLHEFVCRFRNPFDFEMQDALSRVSFMDQFEFFLNIPKI